MLGAEQLRREEDGESYYCKYNDQVLQLFATSMYFTGKPTFWIRPQFCQPSFLTASTSLIVAYRLNSFNAMH